jgi:hypothetical protein
MRSFRLAVSLMAVALFSTSCISEPTIVTMTNSELAGTYILRSVNGHPLPAIIQPAVGTQPKIEILSDQITVLADGTWTGLRSSRSTTGTSANTQTVSSGGTYGASGASVTFRDPTNGTAFTVSVSGNLFLLSDGVLSYLYSK